MLKSILMLIRPHQYVKNFFIFLPIFFALEINNVDLLFNTFVAFLSFSLSASAIYVLNDYHDIEEDRLHPKKKNRPLASGAISKKQAIAVMLILLTMGFALMDSLSHLALGILGSYVVMNIAYSFFLKHVAIIDISIIAVGFVLRLLIGSTVTAIHLSGWIVMMTFLLALFMALAKRRDDMIIYLDTGKVMRKVIDGYNIQFLDTAMAIMAAVVIVAYTNYTLSPEIVAKTNSQYLYLTSVFVILGIMRYLAITFVIQDSGSPTKIVLKDRFIQITLLGWIMTFFWLLY